jgi:hypothetical protein
MPDPMPPPASATLAGQALGPPYLSAAADLAELLDELLAASPDDETSRPIPSCSLSLSELRTLTKGLRALAPRPPQPALAALRRLLCREEGFHAIDLTLALAVFLALSLVAGLLFGGPRADSPASIAARALKAFVDLLATAPGFLALLFLLWALLHFVKEPDDGAIDLRKIDPIDSLSKQPAKTWDISTESAPKEDKWPRRSTR